MTATPDCDQALAADCDAARRAGVFACGECVGLHRTELDAAGCNATYMEQFCSNQTCVLNSASVLGGACEQARTIGPFACAKCLGEHAVELNSSRCSMAQQEDYCEFVSCTPPLPEGPPPVSTRSAVLHGCHHISVTSLTINGKESVEATVPVSTQVAFSLTIADTVSGICTCPTCVTQLFGAIYKYAPDSQLHAPTGPGKCWGSQSSETTPWSGHYTMAFTPAAKGTYYFKSVGDMQMSCSDASVKHAEANFSAWGPQCDGFGPCGGLARIVVA